MLIFDDRRSLIYANSQASDLLGPRLEELVQVTDEHFAATLRWAHLYDPLQAAFAGRAFEGEVTPIYDPHGWRVRCWPDDRGVICRFERVLEKGAAVARSQARCDSLTALPNRRGFFQRLLLRLERARQTSQTFSVAYLDLDRFKWLNDSLGHRAGDALLVAFVRRLVGALPTRSLAARLGGDEFALAFPLGMTERESADLLSSLLLELSQPYTINDRRVALSVSAGMVRFPTMSSSDVDPGALIDLADYALRQAKEKGRGCMSVIDADAIDQFERERGLVRWLHGAVSKRAFRLHYQPLIDARSGRVSAVEALLRPFPRMVGVDIRGLIDLAADEGLMADLGQWILENACQQLATWRRAGHDVQVNINLASAQLLTVSFVEDAIAVLNRNGLRPDDVIFEISEGMAVSEERTLAATIERMLQKGFRLSIDDFGVEYASIGRLARLPIHQVKFDRSLVHQLGGSSREALIVSGLMRVVADRSLGLSVVAEGIETARLSDEATASGATLLQGFGLHRPMPADEVVGLF
ncbi:MAG: bifunctional diguanylate cyclase/phosphodiesterase [Alphaproteobacteria bacterium]